MNRTTKKNNIHRRPGMILLLVVAVLVLLALMGTVYILSASTDKQVSYASNDQANLNYATEGMLSVVRADILNSTLGPASTPLALGSTTPARVWTGPDLGYINNGIINTPMSDEPTGTTPQIASQPWLCGVMPWEPNTTYPEGATVVSTIFNGGNPPSGAELVCSADHISNPASLGSMPPAAPNGSGSTNWLSRTPGGETPFISVLTSYLYDPNDGAFDIAYTGMGLNPNRTTGNGGVVSVPNASVVMPAWRYNPSLAESGTSPPLTSFGTRDAMWNLLPYSSPNGTHYRFAVRIMDTSAMMNVNTGWIANASSPTPSPNNAYYAESGAAAAGYPIYAIGGTWGGDSSASMQAANLTPPTRAGSYQPTNYDLLGWQQELQYYENQGAPNTSGEYTNLYGSGTELQWLAYGGAGGQFGLFTTNRLATQLPDTFGPSSAAAEYFGPGYQAFYTTYSWNRQYASAQAENSPQSLTTRATSLYPARVNLNAPISPTNPSQVGTLTTQIASALQTCGFAQQHCYAYAINYLDYRLISPTPATIGGGTLTYSNGSTSTTATIAGAPANVAMVANALQPFVNEFEVSLNNTGGGANVTAYGVELYNPYTVVANVGGWQIQFFSSALASEGVFTIPTGTTVPAGGYLVIDYGSPPGAPTTSVASTVAASALSPTADYVALEAPCPGAPALGSVTAGFCVADATGFTLNAAPPNGKSYVDVSRSDIGTGYENAIPGLVSVAPSATPDSSLGAANPAATANGSSGASVPLYNRLNGYPGGNFPATVLQSEGYPIVNWADANCIARLCSYDTASGFEPVTWQLGQVTSSVIQNDVPKDSTTTAGGYKALANEQGLAQAYFDFPFDPRAALTSADMPTTGAVEPSVLNMFSLVTRADNPSVTGAWLPYPNLLTRTPGLINVNTAGEVPLYDAIYDAAYAAAGDVAATAALHTSELVADTIAYRDRLAAQSNFPIFTSIAGAAATVTPTGTTPAYNTYPGYNIKSLGDLLLAWLPELETISPNPTSFLQRDMLWAACANNFCVHSDSFAVYGLVQAIRLNPNYLSSGGTVNPTDWYNANQDIYGTSGYVEGALAPTPTVTLGTGTSARTYIPEFILEGQRRFVAIVDSSYSTPPGVTAPKIVAIKYLPQ